MLLNHQCFFPSSVFFLCCCFFLPLSFFSPNYVSCYFTLLSHPILNPSITNGGFLIEKKKSESKDWTHVFVDSVVFWCNQIPLVFRCFVPAGESSPSYFRFSSGSLSHCNELIVMYYLALRLLFLLNVSNCTEYRDLPGPTLIMVCMQ